MNEPTYSLAEIRDGTGWPKGQRFRPAPRDDYPDPGVSARLTPRGPLVDEHVFSYYGNPDPAFYRNGMPGIVIICSCGAVHRLSGGHTDEDLIRLKCNEVGLT